MTTSTSVDSWAKILTQYGFAAALCAAVLYFVGYQMVLPTQQAHMKLIDRVAETNDKNAETNKQNAETQSRQTTILEEIKTAVQARADGRQPAGLNRTAKTASDPAYSLAPEERP